MARWPGREVRSAFLVPHILETIVSANEPEFVRQHRVCGVATVPATGLIDLALGAASHALPGNHPEAHFLVESFGIEQALCLAEEEPSGPDWIHKRVQPTRIVSHRFPASCLRQ